jgi:hypothetical protein
MNEAEATWSTRKFTAFVMHEADAAHLRRDPDHGGLGDPAGAGARAWRCRRRERVG